MSTIQWIPRSDEQDKSTDPVVKITVVAYQPQNETTAGPSDEDTHMTNHWSIYLETGPENSVRADPIPNALEPPMGMVLVMEAKEGAYTNQAHKVIRMNTAKNLTVGTFLELIKANGYDKYQFTNTGNGCRYWVHSVLRLLQEKGYLVEVDEAEAALNIVRSHWEPITFGIQTPLGKQKGKFYE